MIDKKITIRLTASDRAKVEARAKERNMNLSEVMRSIIRKQLKNK